MPKTPHSVITGNFIILLNNFFSDILEFSHNLFHRETNTICVLQIQVLVLISTTTKLCTVLYLLFFLLNSTLISACSFAKFWIIVVLPKSETAESCSSSQY